MSTTIYIERQIRNHKRTEVFLKKFPDARVIEIDKYTEVFNRKNQDFRAQKAFFHKGNQTWILAKKEKGFVQKNPEFCASSCKNNYYFSHLLNCPFDCEYCFLQGMYRSAFYLFFVNFEDFSEEIESLADSQSMFFSSYDADGLALDYYTEFTQYFIPFFKNLPESQLEIRTKSANIHALKNLELTENTLLAWTLSPEEIQQEWEKKTASLAERIKALNTVQKQGWKTAIRIEPIIITPNWKKEYEKFFAYLEQEIDFSKIENIYFGVFKMPKGFLKTLQKMYPESKLFHNYYEMGKDGEMSYKKEVQEEVRDFMKEKCEKLIEKEGVFWSM